MRFLVDENLPLALVGWLRAHGYEADHTSALGLNATPDLDIARQAEHMNAVIVTKDGDYVALARSGRGPCIVHVRSGNLSTGQLLQLCEGLWSRAVASLEGGEPFVEIGSRR